jgi:cobalt/nickel transport system permease protein
MLQSLVTVALSFAGALFLSAIARVPAGWLAARLGIVLVGLALFAAPLPFIVADAGGVWHPANLPISLRGVQAGLMIIARGMTIACLFLTLLAATNVDDLYRAAHALGVPGLLVQMGRMSYRYLFVLREELRRLRTALRVRGFRDRATLFAYSTVGRIAGALLVRGHERSDRVYSAMRCRGFDGQYRSVTDLSSRPRDVFAVAIVIFVCTALLVLDRTLF